MTSIVNPLLRGAELAQATAEYITAHPEEWDQGTWGNKEPYCGTTACFGGTACFIAGEVKWYDDKHDSGYGYLDFANGRTDTNFARVAQTLLDLGTEDSSNLFFGNWEFNPTNPGDIDNTPTRDKVRNMWAKMVELYGNKITVPEEYKR